MRERIANFIQRNPAGAVLIVTSAIFVTIFVLWLIGFLNAGTISISTDSPTNSIKIQQSDSSEIVATGVGKLHTRLHAGEYKIIVSNRVSSVNKLVEVVKRQKNDYTINIPVVSGAAPTFPYGVYGLVAENGQAAYIDTRDHLLYRISGADVPAPISSTKLASVEWQNISHGFGLSEDGKALYMINSNSLSSITLPFAGSEVVYSVSTSGDLYVANNNKLYIQNGSDFKIIYSAAGNISSLKAGGDSVFIRLGSAKKIKEGRAAVINKQGRVLGSVADFEAYEYAWNPDGSLLAATSDNSTELYSKSLHEKVSLPDINVLGLSWLNNNELLYGVGEKVYSYQLDNNDSSQIGLLPGSSKVSEIFSDSKTSNIYVVGQQTRPSAGSNSYITYQLDKTGSRATYVYTIGALLPASLDPCYVSYVSFTNPIIVMQPFSDSLSSQCLSATKIFLQTSGVDIDKLQFSMSSSISYDSAD